MTMPVEPDVTPLFLDDALNESHYCPYAIWSRVAHSVANANGPGSASNSCHVERSNGFRICSSCILRDVHHGHALFHRKGNGVFRHCEKFLEGPIFSKEPYRGGTDEGTGFDGNTGAL